MIVPAATTVTWQVIEVMAPRSAHPVPVVAARSIPYRPQGNRLQTLNLYLPKTPATSKLVGQGVGALPGHDADTPLPRYYVHVHGGAWRDPQLTATSIEPAVALAFANPNAMAPIEAIASIDYTLTHFPTHPTLPYDVATSNHTDPGREAVHPRHVDDVLHAFALLRSFGLTDGSYILSGHSCGACLAFQTILQAPITWSSDVSDAPVPAAMFGLNGLYDLPALVSGLGASHADLRDIYRTLLANAFGPDEDRWPAASPARFDPSSIASRLRAGHVPPIVLLNQSKDDQLVPMNQLERLAGTLAQVEGMRVVRGRRCTGTHAAPWEQGSIIKDTLQDTLDILHGHLGSAA